MILRPEAIGPRARLAEGNPGSGQRGDGAAAKANGGRSRSAASGDVCSVITATRSDDLEIALQLPVGDVFAELALLPLPGCSEVVDEGITK